MDETLIKIAERFEAAATELRCAFETEGEIAETQKRVLLKEACRNALRIATDIYGILTAPGKEST